MFSGQEPDRLEREKRDVLVRFGGIQGARPSITTFPGDALLFPQA
jgi:hypothetical protein